MSGPTKDNARAEDFKRATAGVLRAIAEQPDVQVALYRVAQEALNNIAKHARATAVELFLRCDGNVVELRCAYDPASRGGNAPDGRKVKATLHWVSGRDARPAAIRLYNPLFNRPDPGADGDLDTDLNPGSLEVLSGALLEPSLAEIKATIAINVSGIAVPTAARIEPTAPSPRFSLCPIHSTAPVKRRAPARTRAKETARRT